MKNRTLEHTAPSPWLGTLLALSMVLLGMSITAEAGNVATSTDTSGGMQVTAGNVAPSITGFTIVDASYTTILDAQVDVNTEITVNVTVEDVNGWDDVDTVKVLAYYDGGTDQADGTGFIDQTTGKNYKFMLLYDNTASGGNGQTAPTTAYMSVEYNDATDNDLITEGTHAVSEVTANQKYKLTWKFTPGYQLKQADIPSAADGTAYANANSWNVRINASDAAATTSQKDNGTDAYEFGVYKYTYVDAASNTWDVGSVNPGSNADATSASVTTRSNDDFDLTVWMNADLTCSSPSDTIPTSGGHVKVLAAASASDDVTSDTAFGGNGEANEVTVLADTGYGDHSAYLAGNSQVSTSVNLNIAVPYGTLPGVYTAGLTFQVTQVA